MTLVRASSTARAIALHSDSSQPITAARVPTAPRTTHKYLGSLGTENLICGRRGVSLMVTARPQAAATPLRFHRPPWEPSRDTGLLPPATLYRPRLGIPWEGFGRWRAVAPAPTACRIHRGPH